MTTPESIITIDQNTRRPITWIVETAKEQSDLIVERYGWTHSLLLSRPKGRRFYFVDVVLDEQGEVVKHNGPRLAF